MNTISMTFQETSSQLLKLYSDGAYHKLIGMLKEPTFLEVAGKLGSETVLSSLYAWVFANREFNEGEKSAVMQLLRLLSHEACLQGEPDFMEPDLRKKILANDIKIQNVVVDKEVPTTSDSDNGRIDIVIWASTIINNEPKTLRILIENKVYSQEHDKQCKKYFEFFSKSDNKSRANDDTIKSDIDIYCFLAINKAGKLSDPHFIRITHQEVLDHILIPLQYHYSQFSASSRKYLVELVNSLTTLKTNGKSQIAMDNETKQLLKDFYFNNRDIIESAILAASEDEEIIARVNKVRNPSSRTIINKPLGIIKETNQKSLLGDLVYIYRHEMGLSINQVESKFSPLGKVFTQNPDLTGYDPIEIDGKTLYISNQKARRDTKFDEIKDIAEADGFQII